MLEDQGSTGVMNHAYVPLYESCFLSFGMTGWAGGWAGGWADGWAAEVTGVVFLFFFYVRVDIKR